ncbi:hypothetical protein D3C86_1535300 [compost metagenome]
MCGGHVEATGAANAAVLAIVEGPRLNRDGAFAADPTQLPVVEAGAVHVEVGVGDQLPALVADRPEAIDAQGSGAGQSTRGVDQRACANTECAFAAEQAEAVVQRSAEVNVDALLAEQGSAGVIQPGAGHA